MPTKDKTDAKIVLILAQHEKALSVEFTLLTKLSQHGLYTRKFGRKCFCVAFLIPNNVLLLEDGFIKDVIVASKYYYNYIKSY